MMKKIYLTLGLAVGMLLSSCSDFLDRTPSTSLPTDDAITSLADMQNAINGVGYILSSERMTYGAEYAIYADLKGPDFSILKDYGQSSPIAKYSITKNDELPDIAYEVYYKALANINKALLAAEKLEVSESEADKLKDFKGQLLALRGLLHFDLARMFCKLPTSVDNLEEDNSGLVLSAEVFPTNYKGVRSTLKDTYTQIIQDFSDALLLLGKSKKDGYMNYWSALSLKARAELYYGNNEDALKDAKAVIEGKTYALYTIDNYSGIWSQEYSSESIFELKITDVYNAQRNGAGYYCDGTGYPECGFNTKGYLYSYLSTHPEDTRSYLIKDQSKISTKDGVPGYYPNKYPGRNGNLYVNNPKIIRLSEVYLIAAEAAVKINDESAADFINILRSNRIKDYNNVATVTLQDVLNERRIELFGENHYAFDQWRNKLSVETPQAMVSSINYNDYRTILPIPQREIDQNDNLAQNPEY